MRSDFSAAKIEKKVRKLREQIRYIYIYICIHTQTHTHTHTRVLTFRLFHSFFSLRFSADMCSVVPTTHTCAGC